MCNVDVGVETPLEALLGGIQRFITTPGPELTPNELGKHLIRLRHGIDLLELDFASSAATFAGTDEYENQGSVSPYDWIRHNCHMTAQSASRAVTAGEQFGRLLGSAAALDAGEIGYAHFSLLAGVARALSTKLVAVGAKVGIDAMGGDDAAMPTDTGLAADSATPVPPFAFDERPLLEL